MVEREPHYVHQQPWEDPGAPIRFHALVRAELASSGNEQPRPPIRHGLYVSLLKPFVVKFAF
jgi:hypothetical protein